MFLRRKKVKQFNWKRQWGTEKNLVPLSPIHEKPSTRKLFLSRLAIFLTVFFWFSYILSIIIRQFLDQRQGYDFTMEAFVYATVVTFLTFSALMYLLARLGAFERFSKHNRVPHAILEKYFSENKEDGITVIVPAYNEEPDVVRKTLFSAAIQEYPSKKVVLLIDNNPNPTDPALKKMLEETRDIPNKINTILEKPSNRFKEAYESFHKLKHAKVVNKKILIDLSNQYEWAAKYLRELAEKENIEDHVDVFFRDQVLLSLADDFDLVSNALRASEKDGAKLTYERIDELYQRLVWIFSCKVESFERKKYISLSQEANKAMNLNAYIGLMGGTYREEVTSEGIILSSVKNKKKGDIEIPNTEFLLTLDADSILLKDYCLRLVYFLKQPENEKVAVTQTPYSSFRGAASRIERISGATTDIQHILHQGMSQFGATFWVGANAIIRKKALDDIVESELVRGFEEKRYIQDRTVIEDTESSLDIAIHGWKLMNYPERLSYSATPPDFGSLVIQRRRWANGGLLILPKLWTMRRDRLKHVDFVSIAELMLRINYLASITWASFGLLFLLAYPFNGQLLSSLVLLTAIPYFIAMAIDLKYCRYSYFDIFSIYGFNLILLPVNLAGVFKSIEQALTGKKIPFARTPKIKNRTTTGLLYVVVPVIIVIFSLYVFRMNIIDQNWGNAAFAGFNAVAATWAIIAFIGLRNLLSDVWLGLTNWLYVEDKPKKEKKQNDMTSSDLDWKSVLYFGEKSGTVPHSSLSSLVISTNDKK